MRCCGDDWNAAVVSYMPKKAKMGGIDRTMSIVSSIAINIESKLGVNGAETTRARLREERTKKATADIAVVYVSGRVTRFMKAKASLIGVKNVIINMYSRDGRR